MTTIGGYQSKVRRVEGFEIRVTYRGRDVRDDMRDIGKQYLYDRQAKDDFTVKDFVGKRLKAVLKEGWNVDVLMGNGKAAHGARKLASVRKSYR